MRRSACLLAVALTALLVSSIFWRPLRPGPAPGPEAGPLAYLTHNLGLGPGGLPATGFHNLPAHGPAAHRAAEAGGKTDQLAIGKSVQSPPGLPSLLSARTHHW